MKSNCLILLFVILAFSCTNDFDSYHVKNRLPVDSEMKDPSLYLKKEFAKAFAKVLSESQDVRELIRNEALKKVDYDYDVIFQLVKDKELKFGKSLKTLLLSYLNQSTLDSIEVLLPTLTIFVPELPENTFSAKLWDISTEIPVVGVRTSETNDVPSFDSLGNESLIESYLIPAYPILVIKENERVVKKNIHTKSNDVLSINSDLCFIDEVFDNVNVDKKVKKETAGIKTKSGERSVPDNLKKVYEAFDVYNGTNGWQRDYVYYNISPSNTKGPFQLNFKENLVSFEFMGDAMGALNKIADQTGDPGPDGKWHMHNVVGTPETGMRYTMNGWPDGEFEFLVKTYYGTKSPTGNEQLTYFRAEPRELFEMYPVKTHREDKDHYIIKSIKNLKYNLSLPIFEWDLENYSSIIKIAIEEVDNQESTTTTSTTSSEFAANFGFDLSFGGNVKIGPKFGGSIKETRTQTFTITTAHGNDILGEVLINFGDPIILSKNDMGGNWGSTEIDPEYNNKYETGWYRIQISPKQAY